MFPFTCFSCFLILLPHVCFCMQTQILCGKSQGLNECIKTKRNTFSVEEVFADGKGMCIEIRHNLAWRVHMCVCRICIYMLETLWSLSFWKLSWSSGFRGHLYLEDSRGKKKVFYSRADVPVVYTPKNLLYGLAFSDFVWGYFSGHYKMRTNTY